MTDARADTHEKAREMGEKAAIIVEEFERAGFTHEEAVSVIPAVVLGWGMPRMDAQLLSAFKMPGMEPPQG